MLGVRVLLLDRLGVGGVSLDVAADLACRVMNRSEDAACDRVALDLAEPQFDLVEPTRCRSA